MATRKNEKDATDSETKATFAQHNALADENDPTNGLFHNGKGLTWIGRLTVFIGFPFTMGMAGVYIAYIEKTKHGSEISLDRDFIMPFLASMALTIVIGFQTNGYSSSEVKPMVAWPKVRRVKKVVHKRNGEVIVPPEEFAGAKDKYA